MAAAQANQIVLTTLNARYMHSAFGLRYLYANLGELRPSAAIIEFTIQQRPIDIAEQLLKKNPEIIGFGVYIWNVSEITKTIEIIKQVSPETIIILGGPEVSHLPDSPAVADIVDYVVMGAAEKSFRELCQLILSGSKPVERLIQSMELPLDQLQLPYQYYNDDDIKNRLIYVEASRGCPFKCEFCLSSLDKTSKPFELGVFLDEMDSLYRRGARNFKFIDRTFNLKVSSSVQILEFFLERLSDDLYLHFEVVPDNLPGRLKLVIAKFPAHTLQFEIGVQTFDPEIQTLISRKQDNDKTCDNLHWLKQHTHAYIHADLIFGLPSDTLQNFAKSFDRLVSLQPHEIQLGILKRLRGVPLNRHNENYNLRYNPEPPYNILSTLDIDFLTMQRVSRFARYWDMIANSGRFRDTLPLILGDAPFDSFMCLSDQLYATVGSTWKISLQRLFVLLHEAGLANDLIEAGLLHEAMQADYKRTSEKASFDSIINKKNKVRRIGVANKRQKKMIH
ncbi:MAG: DUF4080 domain-containing protein [Gammaproteobacteria bacterium]|nr:DUF4080 domain-containing protein [Gammaproteobacteria bacterium]